MEVPVINRLGDFQLAIARFSSLISQVLIEQVPEIFSFWKWGALILAVYAIVNSLIIRFKIEVVRFGKHQSAVTKALLSFDEDDYSSDEDHNYSSDEDDEVSVSGSSVNDDAEDLTESSSFRSFFDFREAGSGHSNSSSFDNEEDSSNLTRRFSWSDFAAGKSVVKLWDGIGHDQNLSLCSVFHAPICLTPSLILTAGMDKGTNFILSLTDTRLSRLHAPAIFASWRDSNSNAVNYPVIDDSGDGRKVYVRRDEVSGRVTVADLRNVKAMLEVEEEEVVTEWDDGVKWWDAEEVDVSCRDSVASSR